MALPLIITGKDFRLTPALKVFVMDHVEKLENFSPNIIKVKFELDVDRHHLKGERFRVEGWVTVPGRDLQAGAHATTMQEAVQKVVQKLIRQLREKKDRQLSRRRR